MASEGTLRCGVAGMTSDHVWAMGEGLAAQPAVRIVAAAEPYRELREQAKTRWGAAGLYDDYAAMLEREQLDAILVCGDNASKAEIAELAARKGVHVYQDKPMAATLAQADRILKAVEAAGITYMCAYHSAFSPLYEQTRSLVQGGAIGKVYLARGVTGHGGPREFGCSEYFCEWLFDKRRNGGGTFIDEACYLLDGFVDYLGQISEVSAFTAQIGHRDYLPPDVEDNSVAIVRFASGALGVLDSKWGQVGPAPVRTSFHGAQGTITSGTAGTELYSTAAPKVPAEWRPIGMADVPGHGRRLPGLAGWRAQAPPRGQTGSGGAEQRAFVQHVLAGKRIEGPAGPRIARDVQAVIEAVYRSAESGK
ncbi:MAG TPA: Gfo/Idh/MocA family oxidoreductase, partial [Chloroflexota bacterium]|nr:Gfo/Idh/MocA family oxidoreductase [Chloroflexota bacterium]